MATVTGMGGAAPAASPPRRSTRRSARRSSASGRSATCRSRCRDKARQESCRALNEILADTTILYALYKKHHWNVAGPTFYQLHLLFDKHAEEQLELVDLLAERVQLLGGIAVGDPRHAAELTTIERAPDGAEDVPAQITRLLQAHETILGKTRDGDRGDRGEQGLGQQRPAHERRAAHERAPGLVHRGAPRRRAARRGLSSRRTDAPRAAAVVMCRAASPRRAASPCRAASARRAQQRGLEPLDAVVRGVDARLADPPRCHEVLDDVDRVADETAALGGSAIISRSIPASTASATASSQA